MDVQFCPSTKKQKGVVGSKLLSKGLATNTNRMFDSDTFRSINHYPSEWACSVDPITPRSNPPDPKLPKQNSTKQSHHSSHFGRHFLAKEQQPHNHPCSSNAESSFLSPQKVIGFDQSFRRHFLKRKIILAKHSTILFASLCLVNRNWWFHRQDWSPKIYARTSVR